MNSHSSSDRDQQNSDAEKNPEPNASPDGFFLSEDLFQGRVEIVIQHHGENYRLRKTKTGKLILNK